MWEKGGLNDKIIQTLSESLFERRENMTDFFPYDELTWQEAAELPRDTPLVIPLGSGYEIERIADQLSHPDKIGLLPAIPYGGAAAG